jgi:ABC-type transport system involved in cytochrome c biogenesis permease subunit
MKCEWRLWLPWFAAGSGVLYCLIALAPLGKKAGGAMEIAKAGGILVVSDGRVKPLDSFARVALMAANHRQTYLDDGGKRREAMDWLLNLMASGLVRATASDSDHGFPVRWSRPDIPEKAKVFRIDNDQVALFGLERRPGMRYAQDEIINRSRPEHYQQFLRNAKAARDRPAAKRDLTDVKTLELFGHLLTQIAVMNLDGLLIVPGRAFDDWLPLGRGLTGSATNADAVALATILAAYAADDAPAFNKAVDAYLVKQAKGYPVEHWKGQLECWFNAWAPFYHAANLYVVVLLLAVLSWVIWSDLLRRSAFWLCVVVIVGHSCAIGVRMYIQGRPPVSNLYSSAVFIGWGCVVLTLAMERLAASGIGVAVAGALGFATMIIAHHLGGSGDTLEVLQPVLDTNFWLATHVTAMALGYTATLVAGFMALALNFRMQAAAIQRLYLEPTPLTPRAKAAFLASVVGVVALPALAALGLSAGLLTLWGDGETLESRTALALSLPAFVAAVMCALWLIIPRLFAKRKPPSLLKLVKSQAITSEARRQLTTLIYGTVCFATLLSFVGTVLGGLWADQSWGRFWGWDPKENGALQMVVMNALILHARWAGLIKERGLAALALVGNMVTVWSWFGTNQLGVGLHAYGFNKALAEACALFWLTNLILLVLGLIGTASASAPAGALRKSSIHQG